MATQMTINKWYGRWEHNEFWPYPHQEYCPFEEDIIVEVGSDFDKTITSVGKAKDFCWRFIEEEKESSIVRVRIPTLTEEEIVLIDQGKVVTRHYTELKKEDPNPGWPLLIWLQGSPDFKDTNFDITWCEDKIDETDIPYTRYIVDGLPIIEEFQSQTRKHLQMIQDLVDWFDAEHKANSLEISSMVPTHKKREEVLAAAIEHLKRYKR